jgi:hypothetical protein
MGSGVDSGMRGRRSVGSEGGELERLTAQSLTLINLSSGYNSKGFQDVGGRRGLRPELQLPTELLKRPTVKGPQSHEQRMRQEQDYIDFLESELQFRSSLDDKDKTELLQEVSWGRGENLRHKKAITEIRHELSSAQQREMHLDEELKDAEDSRDCETERRDFSHLSEVLEMNERKKSKRDSAEEEEAELGSLRRENEQLANFLRLTQANLNANAHLFGTDPC